ncbi:MAG: 30S ribosomal protein S18 [Deltaproteobacteria bacterium]|nr:30S ribosomal protein S18 [Deltaproteobacteria bacterium]
MARDYDSQDQGLDSRKRSFTRRRACRFCTDSEFKMDYKNPKLLSLFVTERGKIIPRRISGNCALHQRHLTTSVKQARVMALLPFTSTQR